MNNSNQRLRFLDSYRMHLQHDPDQMKDGQLSHTTTWATSDAPDHVTSVIAVATMALIFASIFLVQ